MSNWTPGSLQRTKKPQLFPFTILPICWFVLLFGLAMRPCSADKGLLRRNDGSGLAGVVSVQREVLETYAKAQSHISAAGKKIGAKLFEIPSMVVVGDQSSGKSSVIASLSGIRLPTGSSITTRAPLEIHLRAAAKSRAELSFARVSGDDASKLATSSWQLQGDTWTKDLLRNKPGWPPSPKDVESAVQEATRVLTSGDDDVSQEKITLRWEHSENVPNLTIIDMPGLVPIGGKASGSVAEDIDQIARKFTQSPKHTIVCIVAIHVDTSGSKAFGFVQNIDPQFERSILVLTQADRYSKGANTEASEFAADQRSNLASQVHVLLDKLAKGSGKSAGELRQLVIPVINRPPKGVDGRAEDWSQELLHDKEREFFQGGEPPWGIEMLERMLVAEQQKKMIASLDEYLEEVSTMVDAQKEKLKTFPELPDSSRAVPLLENLTQKAYAALEMMRTANYGDLIDTSKALCSNIDMIQGAGGDTDLTRPAAERSERRDELVFMMPRLDSFTSEQFTTNIKPANFFSDSAFQLMKKRYHGQSGAKGAMRYSPTPGAAQSPYTILFHNDLAKRLRSLRSGYTDIVNQFTVPVLQCVLDPYPILFSAVKRMAQEAMQQQAELAEQWLGLACKAEEQLDSNSARYDRDVKKLEEAINLTTMFLNDDLKARLHSPAGRAAVTKELPANVIFQFVDMAARAKAQKLGRQALAPLEQQQGRGTAQADVPDELIVIVDHVLKMIEARGNSSRNLEYAMMWDQFLLQSAVGLIHESMAQLFPKVLKLILVEEFNANLQQRMAGYVEELRHLAPNEVLALLFNDKFKDERENNKQALGHLTAAQDVLRALQKKIQEST